MTIFNWRFCDDKHWYTVTVLWSHVAVIIIFPFSYPSAVCQWYSSGWVYFLLTHQSTCLRSIISSCLWNRNTGSFFYKNICRLDLTMHRKKIFKTCLEQVIIQKHHLCFTNKEEKHLFICLFICIYLSLIMTTNVFKLNTIYFNKINYFYSVY